MKLGVLKDIKTNEYRVICTPAEIMTFVDAGHEILVENNAGLEAGFDNEEYIKAGAKIVDDSAVIYNNCDLIVKVKEIEPSEYCMLKPDQIIYTCIHPAANPMEVDALLKNKVISFAAEDTHRYGSPNCEAAGKAGAFFGLNCLTKTNGGMGKFVTGLGGAQGVRALVLGCGVVGQGAIELLHTIGADVTVASRTVGHLRETQHSYFGKIDTMICNRYNLSKILPNIDIVVNCVRWPKDSKDYLITREMVASMQKGSVIVDISNDIGVIETFHETTHDNPTYIDEGVVHYCVSNIPSAIAHTASVAYAAGIANHILSIMDNGVKKACELDGFLRRGMVTYKGYLTHEETSKIQNRPWVEPEVIMGINPEIMDMAPKNTSTVSMDFYPEFYKNKQ